MNINYVYLALMQIGFFNVQTAFLNFKGDKGGVLGAVVKAVCLEKFEIVSSSPTLAFKF